MRLNAQRVNRHVFFANAPKHGQDGLALSFLLGRVGFDTVIVICEEGGRIGFGGGAAVAFKMGTGSTRLIVGTRYTSVSTDGTSRLNFLPITVGLTFGK